ncbi:hypothetical protein EMIT053CA3_90190 [Pseudomonas donghuensis]
MLSSVLHAIPMLHLDRQLEPLISRAWKSRRWVASSRLGLVVSALLGVGGLSPLANAFSVRVERF